MKNKNYILLVAFFVIIFSKTYAAPLVASFNTSNNYPCTGDVVSFTNTTSGAPIAFSWKFGDGTPGSSLTNPTHVYAIAGTYTVTLIATDGSTIDSTKQVIYAKGNSGSFMYSSDTSCAGQNIFFSSNDNSSIYTWNFGDGSGDQVTTNYYGSINHNYSSTNTYTVTLTISGSGCPTYTQTKAINITNGPGNLNHKFVNVSSPDTTCTGSPVSLNVYPVINTGSNFASATWSFDDGYVETNQWGNVTHALTTPGAHTYTVTVSNACGATTSLVKQIYASPTGGIPNNIGLGQDIYACPGDLNSFYMPQGFMAYAWNFGDGTKDSSITNNQTHAFADTGTYNVSVTIYNHCGFSKKFSLVAHVGNSIKVSGNNIYFQVQQKACPGEKVTLRAKEGFKKYVWIYGDGAKNDTTASFQINHAYFKDSTYTVSVKIFNNCGNDTTLTSTLVVNKNTKFPNNLSIKSTSNLCLGDRLVLEASWGYASYAWRYGDGSAVDSSSENRGLHLYKAQGTYTVSVSVRNLCGNDTTLTKVVTVGTSGITINPGDLKLDFQSPACTGSKVFFNAQRGYASYKWSFGANAADTVVGSSEASFIYTKDSVYTVSVTAYNSCGNKATLTKQISVNSNAAPSQFLNVSASPQTICPGEPVALWAEKGYDSYFWQFGNNPNDTLTTKQNEFVHQLTTPGTQLIKLQIKNACGKVGTYFTSVSVDNNTHVNNVGVSTPPNSVCINDPVGLAVGGGSSSYKYEWNFGDGSTAQTIGSGIIHSYTANSPYTVTVAITNNCGNKDTISGVVNVSNGSMPTISSKSFGTAGETSVAGCPGDAVLFFYKGVDHVEWNFGDGTPQVKAVEQIEVQGEMYTIIKHAFPTAGKFWPKIILFNSCNNSVTDSLEIQVQSGQLPSGGMFVSPPTGGAGFTTCKAVQFVAMGGQTYDYDFGDGATQSSVSPTATHVYSTAGNYVANVTVTNGCGYSATYSQSISVINSGGISAVATQQKAIACYGGSDGVLDVSATSGVAPYTYSWSNGATTSTISNVVAGDYSVTIIDHTGCVGVASVSISNGVAPSILSSTTETACGTNTGTASLTASGGSSPYTYVWSNNRTGASVSNLAAGNYTVTTTDNNGCSGTGIVTINASNGASVSTASTTNITCVYGTNGAVDINVTGGSTPYTYSWSNGNTSQDLSGVGAGNYVVQVTDNGNCKTVHNVSVTAPSEISTSASVVGADCGKFNGSGTVSASGGSSPYTYLWDVNAGSKTTATVTGLPAGNYTVIATDNAGCKDTSEVVINNPNAPNVSGTVTNAACYGQSNGSVGLNINGGTSPYLITWIFSGSHASNLTGLSKNVYTVSVQDASGCLVYKNFSVDQPDALTATINANNTISVRNTGSATVSTTGGNSSFTYSWSNNASTQTISDLAAGTYSVTVIDNKGCSASASRSIVVEAVKQEICIVDVNHTYNQNEVIWTRMPGMGTKGYNIYRELNSGGGVYSKANATLISYSGPTSYLDTAAGIDPDKRSYRYRITTVDSSDNESAQSDVHKTMHFAASQGTAGKLNFDWDNYEGVNFDSYILFEGPDLLNLSVVDTFPSNLNTYTHTPKYPSNGVYFVKINAPNTCSDSKSYNDSKSNTAVLGVIGIAQTNADRLQLEVYPNPAKETMNISFVSTEKQQVYLNVINNIGQVIHAEQINTVSGKTTKQLAVYSWPSGVYHIQLITNKGITTQKIHIN